MERSPTSDAGPIGLRALKKARTRAALQEAAMDLFVRNGFDHTTVEEIAEACDVSPRTFFRYFPTKEDVLFADSQDRCAALLDVIARQPVNDHPLDVLHHSLRTIASGYEQERNQFVRRARILERCPSLRVNKAEQQLGWEGAVVDQLERRNRGGITQRSSNEMRLLAAISLAAFRAAFDVWLDDPAADLVGLLDDTFRRLARGFA
jgi:AcrR family transcriptional regulator